MSIRLVLLLCAISYSGGAMTFGASPTDATQSLFFFWVGWIIKRMVDKWVLSPIGDEVERQELPTFTQKLTGRWHTTSFYKSLHHHVNQHKGKSYKCQDC